MQNFANKYVRVSDLSSYMICPRLAFFRFRKREDTESPRTVRSELYREISRSCGIALASDNPQEAVRRAICKACKDMPFVCGFSADEARSEMIQQIDCIVAGLNRESERLGKDRLAAMLRPEAERVTLYSDKLRMSGRIDRIIRVDGQYMPVIVSASAPPENGIFRSDRIKLAAYSLLISEKLDQVITRCAMEYMEGWCIRETEIRQTDVREALSVRRRIEEARNAMPDAQRGKWCGGCTYKNSCVARVSFLDKLYKLFYA